jgi:hypothetical protein
MPLVSPTKISDERGLASNHPPRPRLLKCPLHWFILKPAGHTVQRVCLRGTWGLGRHCAVEVALA